MSLCAKLLEEEPMTTTKLEFNAGIIGRRIEKIEIELLRLYTTNPRTHSRQQLNMIAWSLKRFGFINPVLINHDNMVIAGHGRIKAAQQLDLSFVPALRLDLDELAKRAYGLFDNRLGELGGWDKVILPLELQDLFDIVNL
jgi:ParB-like chromosome segregation protein Spo0J